MRSPDGNHSRLSPPDLPGEELLSARPRYAAELEQRSRYDRLLSRDVCDRLLSALAAPDIEREVSTALAAEFNRNLDKYDVAIDRIYNETHVGGSRLHHNLDGSHTWSGALNVLKREFPDEPEWQLRLQALEHLARDFTTPSGINLLLEKPDFISAKAALEELGVPPRLASDLLNFGAAELLPGMIAASGLILRLRDGDTDRVAQQIGRFGCTSYFAGNALGLAFTAAYLLRMVFLDQASLEDLACNIAVGSVEVILAATCLPFLPLSLALLVGSSVSLALGLRGRVNTAVELEHLFRSTFPSYRSYLLAI